MVIEWLKVKVSPELREKYIQKDEEIWTKALSKYPGFLGKQVWINPKQQDEVVLVIHWESREAWQSVSAKDMEETERTFSKELGEGTYKIVEEGEYQVRKFLQPKH
jgi:uncharacterized protein (TIGR03792 family)